MKDTTLFAEMMKKKHLAAKVVLLRPSMHLLFYFYLCIFPSIHLYQLIYLSINLHVLCAIDTERSLLYPKIERNKTRREEGQEDNMDIDPPEKPRSYKQPCWVQVLTLLKVLFSKKKIQKLNET